MMKLEKAAEILILVCFHHASASVYWPQSSPMDLNMPTPPHIFIPERPETQYVLDGVAKVLQCKARGDPPPTYKWLLNKKEVPSDPNIVVNEQNGSLTMSKFSATINGYYQCEATSPYGVSLSQVIELRSRVVIAFNNEGPGQALVVREGYGIGLPCYGRPTFVPAGHVSWYYKSGSDTQNQIPVNKMPRMEIDANGTLYITQTERGDKRNDYACAMATDRLDTLLLPNTPNYITLDVIPSTELEIKPNLLGHTGSVTADKGGTVVLECFFSGKPPPTITWKAGDTNTVIVNGTDKRFFISTSGARLEIQQLRDDDEGDYWCEAQNGKGDSRATTFLNVTSRPLFVTSSPSIIIATVGDKAKFSCQASGSFHEWPLPPPVWTINGKPLSNKLPIDKYTLSSDGMELTIFNVTKPDRMCVQCNVSNSRGYAFGDGYLAVIDPMNVTSQPSKTIEVDDTWRVNLTIMATSDSCCPVFFSWSLDGRDLPKTALHENPYSYVQEHNSATLSIKGETTTELGKSEDKSKLGVYRCVIWHPAYSDNRTVTMDLRRKSVEEPEKQQQAGTSLWWVWILLGVVVLGLAALAIALMVRYNYPRQEYLLEKEEKKHKLNPEQDLMDQSFTEI